MMKPAQRFAAGHDIALSIGELRPVSAMDRARTMIIQLAKGCRNLRSMAAQPVRPRGRTLLLGI